MIYFLQANNSSEIQSCLEMSEALNSRSLEFLFLLSVHVYKTTDKR